MSEKSSIVICAVTGSPQIVVIMPLHFGLVIPKSGSCYCALRFRSMRRSFGSCSF